MAKSDQKTAIATISNIFMEITIEILLRLNALFLNLCIYWPLTSTIATALCGTELWLIDLKVQVFNTFQELSPSYVNLNWWFLGNKGF